MNDQNALVEVANAAEQIAQRYDAIMRGEQFRAPTTQDQMRAVERKNAALRANGITPVVAIYGPRKPLREVRRELQEQNQ